MQSVSAKMARRSLPSNRGGLVAPVLARLDVNIYNSPCSLNWRED